MGCCVSVHRDPDSAMSDKVMGSSPLKESSVNANYAIACKSQPSITRPMTNFHDFGSKEENYIDSQAWQGSDSEDDFFSVKSNFTPSCSTTPSHKTSCIGSPPLDKFPNANKTCDSKQELSPIEEKGQLVELLRCPFGSDHVIDHQDVVPIFKETQLVKFFQDSLWIDQVATNQDSAK